MRTPLPIPSHILQIHAQTGDRQEKVSDALSARSAQYTGISVNIAPTPTWAPKLGTMCRGILPLPARLGPQPSQINGRGGALP